MALPTPKSVATLYQLVIVVMSANNPITSGPRSLAKYSVPTNPTADAPSFEINTITEV
jgi:hypothetical protein